MTPALNVPHSDATTTTPLLNRFLLLAVLWMAMAAFAAMAVESPPIADAAPIADAPPIVDAPMNVVE